MKRLIIICEGETELEFCKNILFSHFISMSIITEPVLIKKSSGGIVAWYHLKNQIETHLKYEPQSFVTTFIDYYGINKNHAFPNWSERLTYIDKSQMLNFVELNMKNDINDKIRFRFIPYIQLHEFESLLFNDINVFKKQIPSNELKNIEELERIIVQYPNPELINDSSITAPSKRLEKLIIGYNKPMYGSILAEAIGLQKIRAKCPRFNDWVTKLEQL